MVFAPTISKLSLYLMNGRFSTLRAHSALLICNIIWACNFPIYNLLLGRYIEPLALITASLLVTALLSLTPLIWQDGERIECRDVKLLVGAALLMGVGRKVLLMYGLAHTSPIDGSIINTIAPLLVLGLSVMLGIDRFSPTKIIGLTLGMGGAIAVIISGGTSSHSHSDIVGNIMIFGCACATALYTVWLKRIIAKYRITTVMRWIYCWAAIAILPFGWRSLTEINIAEIPPLMRVLLLYVVFIPTYLPNLALNYSLRTLPATMSSIYAYIQPPVAIVLSMAMGLDHPHADTLLAAAVIFIGVGLVIRSYKR